MITRSCACILVGPVTHEIHIEVDTSKSLPSINIIGLPDSGIKESSLRIRSAIKNSYIDLPKLKYIVSLAPANLKKEGSFLDLAIAVSILKNVKIYNEKFPEKTWYIGELSLAGEVKNIRGIIKILSEAKKNNVKNIVISNDSFALVSPILHLFCDLNIYFVKTLNDIVCCNFILAKNNESSLSLNKSSKEFYWEGIESQFIAKRAMSVAIAGKHHILLCGPKGTGKTTLANNAKKLIPSPDHNELLEILSNQSIEEENLKFESPFRSPHYSASTSSLIGNLHKLGEITLAHNGVLFLDEFTEFNRQVIECLRSPLENKYIEVARAQIKYRADCNFQLIATTNLCRCGNLGNQNKECLCSEKEKNHYLNKLRGPVLDRIDIQVMLTNQEETKNANLKVEDLNRKISCAVNRQRQRYAETDIGYNSNLTGSNISKFFHPNSDANNFLSRIVSKKILSQRGILAIKKISMTIADFENRDEIKKEDLLEAFSYRIDFSNY